MHRSTDLATERGLSAWVRSYFGIPFIDRGLTRDGCDCFGLARLILLEQTGIKLPAYPEVSAGSALGKLRTILSESDGPEWIEVAQGTERAFDFVLMRGLVEHEGRKAQRPIHVGVVVEPGRLIHIEDGAEVSVVDYRGHRIRHRITGFYRYHKLA